MKIAAFLLLLFCTAFFGSCAWETSATPTSVPVDTKSEPAQKQPVLVELFTSEGCSSCPPADRALAVLEKQQPVNGVDVITLEFHVDYWDGPGWKDPFSSASFTQRQEQYAVAFKLDSDYTPQMVVDGQAEFVGSDAGKAAKTIEKLASESKGTLKANMGPESVEVVIKDVADNSSATVYLATVEDDLTSNVSG